MKDWLKGLVVGLLVAVATAAVAQTVVTQGGSQNIVDWWVTSGAHRSCTFAEATVTNAAGGTTITALAGRKAIDLYNGGANTIFCRFDGGTPTASTAGGRPIIAATSFSVDVTNAVVIKCIAATGAQSTTAATAVTQCK